MKFGLKTYIETLLVSLRLGLTSFGGPIAHLGYFHNEYIEKRKWLDEKNYADLIALCQFLPGPASSQLGIAIGTVHGGIVGGVMAWIGFTLPSAVALGAFAFLVKDTDQGTMVWIQGLKIVAVAVVTQAIVTMWKKLVTDRILATLALTVFMALLFWRTTFSQVIIIAAAGLIGFVIYRNRVTPENKPLTIKIGKRTAIACLSLFFAILALLPMLRQFTGNHDIAIAESFYRTGSLVFGGGHVVLPLIEQEVVPTGWLTKENFLAGYGAAQAIPGPLFTFSSYLGAMAGGVKGAVIALFSIFLPAFLLIIGTLPFWNSIQKNRGLRGALTGVNAAVVGILIAALYDPLITSAIHSKIDIAMAVLLFFMMSFWKVPAWGIVIIGAAGSVLLNMAGF